jgi:hypothetical protein
MTLRLHGRAKTNCEYQVFNEDGANQPLPSPSAVLGVDNRFNRFAHLRAGSLAIFVLRLALEALLHFGLLAIFSLLFLLAFLECLVTTSRQSNLLFQLVSVEAQATCAYNRWTCSHFYSADHLRERRLLRHKHRASRTTTSIATCRR